jgi:phosphoheptose isomerase
MIASSALEMVATSLEDGARLRLKVLDELSPSIVSASQMVADSLAKGGRILLCGNGGSAADAQHLAAEFVGRFVRERRSLPALALTTDSSALTAIGNDYGFETVFARQIEAFGRLGDVLIGISTSGNSPNVLAAVEAAKSQGLQTIGLTGKDGGMLAKRTDIPLVVPSANTARIQECHIAIGHIICELVEEGMFAAGSLESNGSGASTAPACQLRKKIMNWEELLALRTAWKKLGKNVVWTNGCFDLVHVGHIHSLTAARELGDVLVIGLNSDASVRQLKGPTRPIIPQQERAELLAALTCVDAVIIFDELTPAVSLAKLRPDIHCKGADYAPPHGKPVPEAHLVESYGGKVRFLPLVPDTSTTGLIERIAAANGAR